MGNLLETGSAWLELQRHTHCTSPVTYFRGVQSVTLDATVGQSDFEQVDSEGFMLKTEARDYLVRTTDLLLGGLQTLPRKGDKIIDAAGITYEVMAPGGEPPFRYSDDQRLTLRIHTKAVG